MLPSRTYHFKNIAYALVLHWNGKPQSNNCTAVFLCTVLQWNQAKYSSYRFFFNCFLCLFCLMVSLPMGTSLPHWSWHLKWLIRVKVRVRVGLKVRVGTSRGSQIAPTTPDHMPTSTSVIGCWFCWRNLLSAISLRSFLCLLSLPTHLIPKAISLSLKWGAAMFLVTLYLKCAYYLQKDFIRHNTFLTSGVSMCMFV